MSINKLSLLTYFISSVLCASDNFRISGSSTAYPFLITVAEEYKNNNIHSAPVIENVGSGGGIRLFCNRKVTMAMSSRKITDDEIELCNKHDIQNIEELIIGYDAIIFAGGKSSYNFHLSYDELFLAIAKYVYLKNNIVPNPYHKWNQINPDFPDEFIEIYGPSYTSGTREILVDMILKHYCTRKYINDLKSENKERICSEIRDDGRFIEIGENYNLIIEKIKLNQNALGIMGFNFLGINSNYIKASHIGNIYPSTESIANNQYQLARPLYLYYNKEIHEKYIEDFIGELKSESAIGSDGYLTKLGLITKK